MKTPETLREYFAHVYEPVTLAHYSDGGRKEARTAVNMLLRHAGMGVKLSEVNEKLIEAFIASSPTPDTDAKRASFIRAIIRHAKPSQLPQVDPATCTLSDYVKFVFMPKHLVSWSPSTRNNYTSAVWKFCTFAGDGIRISDITKDWLTEFVEWGATTSKRQYAVRLATYIRTIIRDSEVNPDALDRKRPLPKWRPGEPERIIDCETGSAIARGGMLLIDFVEVYAASRDLRPASLDQLRWVVTSLCHHVGRNLETSELSAGLLTGWIETQLKAKLSRKTIAGRRGNLLCIWREAHRKGLAPPVLGDVRRVRVPKPIPQAWLPAEFNKILAAINDIPGEYHFGVPRRLLLRAFALTGFYSGLRPCDLFALRSEDVLADSNVVIRQLKTGDPIRVNIPEDAMAAILATKPEGRELVFPLNNRTCWYWFRKALRGLNGSPKWLRRTGATQVEILSPGSAMAFLGHRTPGLAHAHYVDARQIADNRPMPPTLKLFDGEKIGA